MPELIENLVSTIIPVRNRPVMLREAVESVLAQTYRPIEVIICDDNSTDDTFDIACRLAEEYPEEIRVVKNPMRGPGPARETARQLARGEFIQYLDSDDLLLPRKFQALVAALREHPECGAAYGPTRVESIQGEVLAERSKLSGQQLPNLFPELLVERWWNTLTPLYRRTVCDAVGPWSTFAYSQDYEYDARVGALGVRLAYCDETLSVVRVHPGARQTGHGKWLHPKDRVTFFGKLLECAMKAGVSISNPLMKRFSRWVFTHARYCAAAGEESAARECLLIAITANGIKSLEHKTYETLSDFIGWEHVGKICCWLDRLRSYKHGFQRGI
jgi:glycosyltransferase involved in cell wall biosynthesis